MSNPEDREPDFVIQCHACKGIYKGVTLTPDEMKIVREQLKRPDLPTQSQFSESMCECYRDGFTVLESPLPELKDVN